MTNKGIKNIVINLKNDKSIIADNTMFSNLYVSYINNLGDEEPYTISEDSSLISNFFMIKLKNKIIEYNLTNKMLDENVFKLIKNEKNIDNIVINFNNGNIQPFIINSNNIFHTFKQNNDLCIIQSEYDIKYYENLFN